MNSDLMTTNETVALAEAEQVIERGIKTFTEVGNALLKIRDGRLYRAEFGTFEDYCCERWGFSDSRARQLIGAAQTVTNVTAAGLPAPANEGQARALARVPEPERADVWRETVERTNGKPTAAAIRETYRPPRAEPEEKRGPEPTPAPPETEPGIWHGGPAEPPQQPRPGGHTEGDARRDAELAAAVANSDTVFRRNFRHELSVAFTLAKDADIDRVAKVFGAPGGDREALLRSLAYVRDWCDQTIGALNNTVQLRVVGGSE